MPGETRSKLSFWMLLVIGVAIRCIALNQPLIDAQLIRQCQTADATRSMLKEPGFELTSKIPWIGDIDADYLMELPVYNYLVIAVHAVTGNLDMSGKLTAILLWAASFVCLQALWRRVLDPRQTFWANLLFTVAPLSVFYSQAFMPETLVQLLAFGFLLLSVRYYEQPTLRRWTACVTIGLLGLLVKFPEIAHLYLVLLVLVFWREGWKGLLRPRYLVGAVITVVALGLWGYYRDAINSASGPGLSSSDGLRYFAGTLEDRLRLKSWLMILFYCGAFIAPGATALACIYGLWHFVRHHRQPILGCWLASLAVFYLVWFGSGPTSQSYYNLPALAPLCALAGIGIAAILTWGQLERWRTGAKAVAVLLVVAPAVPVLQHLFKQDRLILAAAQWARVNTNPTDVSVLLPRHRWDMVGYPLNPVFAYYAERPSFVWTPNTNEQHQGAALERGRYLVATQPQPPLAGVMKWIQRYRPQSAAVAEPIDPFLARGFTLRTQQDGFAIYERSRQEVTSP